MATMEKLMKAFESLKSFQQQQGPPTAEELVQRQKKEQATTKKDRVTHCLTICENIVAQSLSRTSPEFQKLLGIAMEMFLLCSDDSESDVRMVADECLNKIIKALMDSNLPRLQLELYKEIKKNGASRSLRAALWRFAELAHLIRPQKCRPYLVNLLPCLTRITKRQEETVQETLASGMPKIMSALGHFANDGEIKVLLKSLVANLKSSSPAIRRTAASSAVSVCQHSRRASYFYTWLLNVLLGLVIPVDEEHFSHLILGVLLTLRYLMPLLQQQVNTSSLKGSFGVMKKEADVHPTPEQLLQVYEVTLHYTQHWDHNVVTASLELLQQTFRTPPPELLHMLITVGTIPHATVFRQDTESRVRSGSILETFFAIFCSHVNCVFPGKMLSGEEDGLEDDSEKTEVPTGAFTASVVGADVSSAAQVDIITEQPRSSQHTLQPDDSVDLSASSEQGGPLLSTNDGSLPASDSSQTTTEGPDSAVVTPSDVAELVLDGSESQYSGMQIGTLQDEEDEGTAPSSQEEVSFLPSALALSKPHLFDLRGHNRQGSDSSVDHFIPKEESTEIEPESKPSSINGPIGHYTDQGAEPLMHCVRLLAASFLLTGQKNGVIPDKEVRVSVKALAVSCIGAAGALLPEAFFNSLYLEPLDEQQYVSDVLDLIHHGDPQIRGATAILCAAIIQAALMKTRYHIHTWLASVQSATGNPLSLVDLVPLLRTSLKDESSVTCKMACFAVRHCIMTICSSTLSELGLQLVIDLLALTDSSYWLVRTELLETLAELDFRLVNFLERKTETLHKGDHHYTGHLRLQDRVLNVVIRLLGDDDPRVRHVAASAVSRLVSRLFYDCDQGQTDPVVAIARDQSSVYLQLLMHEAQPPSQFTVSTITRTYRGFNLSNMVSDITVENNLSRVVTAISHAFSSSTSRALTFGCCEALCLLSSNFPVCTWSTGWHCGYVNSNSTLSSRGSLNLGMTNMVLSLLSSAWFPLDLSAHRDALLLAGNLLVTLDLHNSHEKFGGFLRAALDVLSQLLELATLHDISKCVEEILGYLKSCFSREPTMATVCVQQLLKTLFGTNLASQYESVSSGPSRAQGKVLRLGSSSLRPGLYHYCFMAPYTHFTQALADASLRNMVQAEQEQDASGWFDVMQKASNQLRSNIANATRHRGDKNAIHNHIRLFEPLVIKALKQYTTSTSVALQRQVLDLLAQLVQLRVNYCLLDSDQVFIGFVLKQFEYIEVGQFRDSEAVIPNIFFFLVLLSYERYHSKQIISIPKIIQLCDGIMASGRKAVTHAIPALQPIVHDLFVLRGSNKADAGKELDTQKEVVVSMLLRLVQYHQVLEMFILVLQQCHKENEDKWKRLSRQIADVILPMIAKQQMHLDSPEALGVLNTLFETVAPSSLRPVDMLLKSMFVVPCTMASVTTVQLWVSGILAVLRVLVSQSTEDIVLSRVHELSLSPHLLSCNTVRRLYQQSPSPNTPPTLDSFGSQEHNGDTQKALPEETFARFLLQMVGVLLNEISCKQVKVDITEQQHTFYCQQLGTLLMCLIHIFKSGMFRRITAAASLLLKGEGASGQNESEAGLYYHLEILNSMVQGLITTHPSLVLLWCQVLLLINYTNYSWWTAVHQTPRRHSRSCTKLLSPHSSGEADEENPVSLFSMINREIVRRGALILFCDYVCQNLHDSEHLTWLIVNHVSDLISLSHEPPVQDFISAVHRNSAASGLFIQAIQSRCYNLTNPTMLKKTLQCLEGIHLSQSGSLLMLYVDKLLSTPFRVLARMVDTLACRRVEMLLAETLQNSIAQLPVEELDRIQEYLQISSLAQRHQRFYSLLDRFRASVATTCSPAPPVTSHPLDGHPPPAPELVNADKEWYVSLVRSQCCLRGDVSLLETTELLTKLPAPDLFSIMRCEAFNLSLLCPCLSMGVQRLTRGQGPLLLETALQVTLEQLAGVMQSLPGPHRSFLPTSEPQSYWTQLADVYGKKDLITTFTCTATEVIVWRLIHDQLPLSVDLQWSLACLCLALQQTCIWNKLSTKEYATHTCSLIYCLRLIMVAVAVSPGDQLLVPEKKKNLAADAEGDEVDSIHTKSCEIMAELVEGLQSILSLGHRKNSAIPAFLTPTLRNIVISIARLPLVNSFTRVPPLVWKLGWSPQPEGEFGTALPEIPVDFLQEKDVFREFLYRINILGWSSRTQFEETWATLLGVLVTQPITIDQEEDTQQEEDLERTQLNVLAVQAITSLVLGAMMLPTAGNPAVSCLEQQPRNKSLKALETRFGRKLAVIRGEVEREIQALVSKRDNIHTHHPYHAWDPVPSLSAASAGMLISHEKLLLQINTEREMGNMDYKLGQVSIHSVWLGNNITPLREEEWGEDEEDEADTPAPTSPPLSPINSRKHRAGVDIHSCSQFLLELYSQWLIPSSPSNRKTPTILVSEVVRSLLAVSDLFTERNQFDMMFSTLMELQKLHPPEDEILNQYLVPAICKAAAVLGMDKVIAEPVCRLLESTLRSTHLPSRMGALHGVLYVLECDLLDDTAKQLIPSISEYLLSNLRAIAHCVNLHNQQHVLVMCAVAFYMMENYPLDVGADFMAAVIQVCGVMVSASEDSTPSVIYHCVLRGLERLLLSEQLSRVDGEALVKLSVDRVNMPSPHRAMAALGLMLTCMYTGKEKASPAGRPAHSDPQAPDSESIIVAMERVSVLFDRIRKGLPSEARVVSRILPQFLDDFFPPQDVMNKVIGEFLSNQQPYPQFMATVVYKVFQTLHATGQSSMVRDWVLLSLSNFTQRTPVAMAMWSLSCFFVSASTSQWISALLPHVISRMGSSEVVDVNLFCLVAMDFYRHQIDEELDRRAFQSVFETVASPGSPYYQLLVSLQSIHQDTTL
uniref:Huntingtin n=1 Tax=Hippocampus comes TaxID=109280 RepID=A0A3Q2YC87_HIPCM